MNTVGDDFAPYAVHLENIGISQQHLRHVSDSFIEQAFITTDLDDNQITAFHPGAISMSHLNHVSDAQDVSIGIVSPDGRDSMIQHAEEFVAAKIPFVFDSGQGMPMFSEDDLLRFIQQADYITVNDYEAKLLQDKSGGKQIAIPSPKPPAVVDPTGSGDAYRAGLLYWIQQGWDWETTGRLASMMGSLKKASRGGQNHKPMRQELMDMYHQHFGKRISL